ncbi:hypothetical protein BH23ACI1_BH23ACI1_12630 [soil metagenome]|nr:YfiR family protein [Acidobacteriota bacterium]
MAILSVRSLAIACLAVLAGTTTLARPAVAQDTLEHEIRAAFIYNFTRFIDWPPAAVPPDEFRICVVGDPRFATALDGMIAGEAVQGRPIVRRDPATPDEARACQILYVSRQEPERGARTLTAVRHLPVLTVGDAPRFLEQGGAVRFLLEEGRVRFDVDMSAVDRAGLTMTSKLLRVARRVENARR